MCRDAQIQCHGKHSTLKNRDNTFGTECFWATIKIRQKFCYHFFVARWEIAGYCQKKSLYISRLKEQFHQTYCVVPWKIDAFYFITHWQLDCNIELTPRNPNGCKVTIASVKHPPTMADWPCMHLRPNRSPRFQ